MSNFYIFLTKLIKNVKKFNMISASDIVEEIVKSHPLLEEGLSQKIINFSALARKIKPQIEKKLYKTIKTGAVIVALKRMGNKAPQKKSGLKNVIALEDITIRSNLTEITFANSNTLFEKQRILFQKLANKKDAFCTVSQGIRETTLIANQEVAGYIREIFTQERLLLTIDFLSSITIRLPDKTIYTPGVYYQILKQMAWENINIIEIVSSPTELTIVFNKSDIEKAFLVLKGLSDQNIL